jgi:hypothetical protein
MDVPAPGVGGIIGGSQCEERVEVLDRSMAKRGIDDHAIAIIALYVHGSERVRNHRMESPTPDLDLIKQAEQGTRDRRGRLPRAAPVIRPTARRITPMQSLSPNLPPDTQREMLRRMLATRRFEESASADYLAARSTASCTATSFNSRPPPARLASGRR